MGNERFELPDWSEFADGPRERRSRFTAGRLLALALVLVIAGAVGLIARVGPDALQRLAPRLANLAGRSPHAMLAKAQQHLVRGENDRALAELDRLQRLAPHSGDVQFLRGIALGNSQRNPEAVDAYSRAIELGCSQLATAYNNRAYTRALARVDLAAAMEDVQKALEFAGDNPAFLDTRGYIHYLQGRQKLALADLNAVLEDPTGNWGSEEGLGEIYFHRGLVHRELGEEDLAAKDFDLAKRLGFNISDFPKPVAAADRPQSR
jgi:tetratricopeptide (TPR) repeat protein